jgi:hypothetical protein
LIFSSFQNQNVFSSKKFTLHSALHGRSAKILSKVSSLKILFRFLASFFVISTFSHPCLLHVNFNFSSLIVFNSFATTFHVLLRIDAIWLVLLQGAAVTSKTISFSFKSKKYAGIWLEIH